MGEKIYLLVNTEVRLPAINDLNVWAIGLESDVYLSKYPTRKINGIYRSVIDVPENTRPGFLPDFERERAGGDCHILRGEYVELDVEVAEHGEKIIVTFGTTRKYTEKFPEMINFWHSLSNEEKYNFSCKLGDFLASLGRNDEDEDDYE